MLFVWLCLYGGVCLVVIAWWCLSASACLLLLVWCVCLPGLASLSQAGPALRIRAADGCLFGEVSNSFCWVRAVRHSDGVQRAASRCGRWRGGGGGGVRGS